MKKIEGLSDFIVWARDVNFNGKPKRICDLQDVFAHSDEKELKALFLTAEKQDKQLLTFSIIKAMGEDTAYRFIKAWAMKQAQICIDENMVEIDRRFIKLSEREFEFSKKESGLLKEIEELKSEVSAYEEEGKRLHIRIDEEMTERNRLANVVFDQQTRLNENEKEIEKTYQFKAYLRGIFAQ